MFTYLENVQPFAAIFQFVSTSLFSLENIWVYSDILIKILHIDSALFKINRWVQYYKNYSGSTLNYIEGNVVFLIAILEKFQAPLDNLVLFEIIYYALGTDLALVVQWL